MSQSAVQKPSIKHQTASNAGVEALWLGPLREREREKEREHTSIHRGRRIRQEKYFRYNRLTLAPPTHKPLPKKYWRLKQEGSGDTVAPSDDVPGQGQTGRI